MRKHFPKILLLIAMIISLQQLFQVRYISRSEINKQVDSFNNKIIEDINKEKDTNEEEDKSSFSVAESQLNTVGILYVPEIDLRLSIYDNAQETAITNGAGIISESNSLEKLNGVHTIITSHNGSNSNDLFMNIDRLKKGSLFYIKNLKGEILEYKVFHIDTVEPINEENTFLEAPADKNYFTLRTCTPSGGERVHVTGEFTRFVEEDELPKNKITLSRFELSMIGLFIFSFISLIVLIILDKKEKKKKEEKGGIKNEENI